MRFYATTPCPPCQNKWQPITKTWYCTWVAYAYGYGNGTTHDDTSHTTTRMESVDSSATETFDEYTGHSPKIIEWVFEAWDVITFGHFYQLQVHFVLPKFDITSDKTLQTQARFFVQSDVFLVERGVGFCIRRTRSLAFEDFFIWNSQKNEESHCHYLWVWNEKS